MTASIGLRWEYYPDLDELFSIALFAKRFQDPIERIFAVGDQATGTRVLADLYEDAYPNLRALGDGLNPCNRSFSTL